MSYEITDQNIATAKMTVIAELLVNSREIEISEFLLPVIDSYRGAMSKRLETLVSKQLALKYGTYEYKYNNETGTVNFNKPSEYDKTINNVSAYLSSETYSRKYFKLTINYKGTEVNYDRDTKKNVYVNRNKSIQFYSFETLEELRQQVVNRIQSLNSNIVKLKDNQKHLDKYAREYNKLINSIETYNSKISYAIEDTYRVK